MFPNTVRESLRTNPVGAAWESPILVHTWRCGILRGECGTRREEQGSPCGAGERGRQKVTHPQRAPGYPLPPPGPQKETPRPRPRAISPGGAHGDAGHTDPKGAQAARLSLCFFPDHTSPLCLSPVQFHRSSTRIYFLKIKKSLKETKVKKTKTKQPEPLRGCALLSSLRSVTTARDVLQKPFPRVTYRSHPALGSARILCVSL